MRSLQQQKFARLPASDASDGSLVKQARAGDQRAFETLVDRYYTSLFGYCRTLLKDKDQTDDAVQFVFLQLYVFLPTLTTEESLKAWLFRVARNRCFDDLRKRRREHIHSPFALPVEAEERSLREELLDPNPLPKEVAVTLELQSLLQRALFTLSPVSHTIVHLHSFKQLNFAEIARLLNIPHNTVKTSFYRSLPRLRTALMKDVDAIDHRGNQPMRREFPHPCVPMFVRAFSLNGDRCEGFSLVNCKREQILCQDHFVSVVSWESTSPSISVGLLFWCCSPSSLPTGTFPLPIQGSQASRMLF